MRFERGTVEISLLGGTSLPVPLFSANADHNLTMASFQIGRVMAGGPNGNNLQLIVDGSPFMQVRQPDAVFGWSVSPLFVRWNFPPAGDRGARIFGEIAGGLLFTSQPVPVRTTTLNFLDQAGFGVRFEESEGRAWLIGYRFQHVSNAGRVKPNPGANFNFVYLAFSFIR
jgi:Lipid A 3-O-deacylase (PagL)